MRGRSRTRRAATGAQFRPTQLPGCVLWLRADLGLTFGGMGTVTAAGTTPPTVTLSGVPNGPYSLRIETGAGALGAATFRASLDGGATWPYTGTTGASVPLSSPIASGITVAFGAGTYAADNVYTSASAVSQWSDQSGAGHNATQGTLATMPRVTSNVRSTGLRFATAANLDTNSMNLATPSTWYVVASAEVSGDNQATFGATGLDANTQLFYIDSACTTVSAYSGGAISVATARTAAGWHVYCVEFGASGLICVDSAASVVSGNTGSNTFDAARIGAHHATAKWGGNIASVIAYAGAHDLVARDRVVRWLGGQYGIAIS